VWFYVLYFFSGLIGTKWFSFLVKLICFFARRGGPFYTPLSPVRAGLIAPWQIEHRAAEGEFGLGLVPRDFFTRPSYPRCGLFGFIILVAFWRPQQPTRSIANSSRQTAQTHTYPLPMASPFATRPTQDKDTTGRGLNHVPRENSGLSTGLRQLVSTRNCTTRSRERYDA